jgi:hypothetical protein
MAVLGPARFTSRAIVLLALLGPVPWGCAALTCKPTTVTVVGKEERARVENLARGLYRTTATGRLEPALAPGVTREYWVEAEGGEWYRVTAEQFKSAHVQRSIEVCR